MPNTVPPVEDVIEVAPNTVTFVIDSNDNNIASVTFTDSESDIIQTRNVNSNGLSEDELNSRCIDIALGIKNKISVGVTPASSDIEEE